jgi:iron complex transport system permease protein
LGLLALIAIAISVGPYPGMSGDLVAFLIAKTGGPASPLPAVAETVILQIRLPRVLAALAVGAARHGSRAGWCS